MEHHSHATAPSNPTQEDNFKNNADSSAAAAALRDVGGPYQPHVKPKRFSSKTKRKKWEKAATEREKEWLRKYNAAYLNHLNTYISKKSSSPTTTDAELEQGAPTGTTPDNPPPDPQSTATDLETSPDGAMFPLDNNDVCETCGEGGNLLCCDYCTLAFHLKCCRPVLYQYPADEEWYCCFCVSKGVTRASETLREEAFLNTQQIETLKAQALAKHVHTPQMVAGGTREIQYMVP